MLRPFLTLIAATACAVGVRGETPALGWDLEPKPLAQIPAGTRFAEEPPEGWSHIVLLVKSRIASGDVEAVSNTVKHYTGVLKPVLLANTRQGAAGNYELDKVAIGFSAVIDEQYTVVTSDTHRKLGANLGFIGGHVLAGNEAMLKDFRQVARSPASTVIDAPVMMLHEDEHVDMTLRLAIWVDSATGQLGTVVWLLEQNGDPAAQFDFVEEVFQFLPENMREDRVLNVKKNRFTFGIPAKDAFAMVRIPQGTPFSFTDAMRTYAGLRQFKADNYRALWTALAEAMEQ